MAEERLASITQDEYRKLLEADQLQVAKFTEFPEAPPGERWRCKKCGAVAKVTLIGHPIWDGPLEGAGRGASDYRDVPFCPHCDGERPFSESGMPIRVEITPGRPTRIMRRLDECLFRVGLHPTYVKYFRQPVKKLTTGEPAQ